MEHGGPPFIVLQIGVDDRHKRCRGSQHAFDAGR